MLAIDISEYLPKIAHLSSQVPSPAPSRCVETFPNIMQNNCSNKIEAQQMLGSHFGLKEQIHVEKHPPYNTELVNLVYSLRFINFNKENSVSP